MLSQHALRVRRIYVVPAPSLHVLRHERHRSVPAAVRTRHGRLLLAAGRRREDLARYFRSTRLHRLPADGGRKRPPNVAPYARHWWAIFVNYVILSSRLNFRIVSPACGCRRI
jgi:hypothetical protein